MALIEHQVKDKYYLIQLTSELAGTQGRGDAGTRRWMTFFVFVRSRAFFWGIRFSCVSPAQKASDLERPFTSFWQKTKKLLQLFKKVNKNCQIYESQDSFAYKNKK